MYVIDGVIWQKGCFSDSLLIDISDLWLNMIAEWIKEGKADKFVVLTRGQSWLPPGTFFSEIPLFNFDEVEEDRTGLQSACDQLSAKVFLSTAYTTTTLTPSIAFVYDLEAEAKGSQFHPEVIEKRIALMNASHYITFSEDVFLELNSFYPGIKPEKKSLVYPAIEGWAKAAPPNSTAEFRRKFFLNRPFFLAVLPSDISDYSGLLALAQSWEVSQSQKLKSTRIELVFAFLQDTAIDPTKSKFPTQEGIHYLNLTNAELACAYSSALATISHPTFRKTSQLEAMACGCPVINYNQLEMYGSLDKSGDNILEASSSIICRGSVRELSEALSKVQVYSVRSSLIQKGLKLANKFSWSSVAGQIWEIIESAISSNDDE